MKLTDRMQAVADLVSPGNRMADIGTDHAYVPCYLVQHGICPSALAMDVREGPLVHARASIEKYGLQNAIEIRLSDGLKELKPGEADSIVIAGMGGMLMIRILEEGRQVLSGIGELILQPQSDYYEFRHYLENAHYRIVKENMIFEDGKYYVCMRVLHGDDEPLKEYELRYGRLLIREKHPVLIAYLEKELFIRNRIIEDLKKQDTEKSRLRLKEMTAQAEEIRYVLSLCGRQL